MKTARLNMDLEEWQLEELKVLSELRDYEPKKYWKVICDG